MANQNDLATRIEDHIAWRISVGQQPSEIELSMMRGWPAQLAAGEPHPWYGPCDGMGPCGDCTECKRVELDDEVKYQAWLDSAMVRCPTCHQVIRNEHDFF